MIETKHFLPYRPAFEAIESAAQSQNLTTLDAYVLYEDALAQDELDPTIYLSMAITSGGYRRDETLGIGEVIDMNSEFGTLAAELLVRQFPDLSLLDIVVPSQLGKVKGWSQGDYLLFWSHVITGLSVDDARLLDGWVRDEEIMNQPALLGSPMTDQEKWPTYSILAHTYSRKLSQLVDHDKTNQKRQPSNMQAAIFILDQEMSLGARAEAELCRSIGIPPQWQTIGNDVVERASIETQTHLKRLAELGAVALGTDTLDDSTFNFVGISQGITHPNLAFELGFRKTGLNNAIMCNEWYVNNSMTHMRPPRHQGHNPIKIL